MKYSDTNTSSKGCPSCRNPHLEIVLVDLDNEMLVCDFCGWEETEGDPNDFSEQQV